uniref:hypothetical protein n=1 Tax=Methylogaea oryzae TaxID=1295382 RepID=UPI001C3F3C71
LVLRGKIPELVSVIAGNAITLGGMLAMLNGIYIFSGRRLNWRIPLALIGILIVNHTYFTLVHNSLAYRWVVMAGLIAITKAWPSRPFGASANATAIWAPQRSPCPTR